MQYDLVVGDSVRKVDCNVVFEKGSFSYSPLIYEIVNKVKRKYFLRNPNTNHTLLKGKGLPRLRTHEGEQCDGGTGARSRAPGCGPHGGVQVGVW